jgi:Icc-related predicted phosphoesterase
VKLVLISDTHGQHADVTVPEGDMLVHAGDFSEGSGPMGLKNTIEFLDWFALQPHQYKIFIAGNHDFWAAKNRSLLREEAFSRGLIYLQDEWVIINNVKFWGTPWVPNLPQWAFHERNTDYAARRLAAVDTDVDVMISHGPPRGIGDVLAHTGEEVGCPELRSWVDFNAPRYHIFGHVHEGSGVVPQIWTTFINASVVNEDYRLTNDAVVVEL